MFSTFRILLVLILLASLCIGSLLGYLKLTRTETVYRCEGTTRYTAEFMKEYGSGRKNPNRSSSGHLKVAESSSLVMLWADDRYSVWWEDSAGYQSYYGDIRDIGQNLNFYNLSGKFQGRFSKISKSLSLTDGTEIFTGDCKI